MEVYILDSLLRRTAVVDRFVSLIWTERFQEMGDFELTVQSTLEMRSLFTMQTKLVLTDSRRVMVVESTDNKIDDEGRALLVVKGRSLELILADRVAKDTLSDTTTEPRWVLTGTPGDIARQMFTDICITGTLNAGDVVPFITAGTVFPDDTIDEPADVITYEAELDTLYNAIKKICDLYDLGFRLVRHPDLSTLHFDIYAGCDRTTLQTDLNPVIFSPELDSLKNSSEYTSVALAKNCAYVFSPVGYEVVYPDLVDPDVDGFERRVLVVKADDITEATGASAAMIQRGKEALSQNRSLSAFDGELNQDIQYKYGVDYNLGDLVEIRNADGVTSNMRVTEQIFVSDSEGDRSYPTLAINLYINPGSWLGWDASKVWEDMGLTEYWENA